MIVRKITAVVSSVEVPAVLMYEPNTDFTLIITNQGEIYTRLREYYVEQDGEKFEI